MTTWVEQYFEAWAGKDPAKVGEFVTDDVDFEDTTMKHRMRNKRQFEKFVAGCFVQVPTMRYEVVDQQVLDNAYWIEWIMQPMGLRGASVGRLRDGKIAYNRDYWDGASFTPGAGSNS